MQERLRHATLYFLIALLAFTATYAFLTSDAGESFLRWSEGRERTVSRLLQTDPCPADAAGSFSCWDAYYERLLDEYGSHVALYELKARYEGGGPVRGVAANGVNYPRLWIGAVINKTMNRIVAMPKFALAGMAWQGYFLDTEGNTFGVHQPDENAK